MRKMSKPVREFVEQANKSMLQGTLTENQKLFHFVDSILMQNKMYHGYNFYCKTDAGNLYLAGADKSHWDINGIFRERETDVRQFYIR